jgi:hypothetical protein
MRSRRPIATSNVVQHYDVQERVVDRQDDVATVLEHVNMRTAVLGERPQRCFHRRMVREHLQPALSWHDCRRGMNQHKGVVVIHNALRGCKVAFPDAALASAVGLRQQHASGYWLAASLDERTSVSTSRRTGAASAP